MPRPQRTSRFETKLAAKVERESKHCAVWCIGPRDGIWRTRDQNAPQHPVKFGVTKDPDELLRKARSWHWEDIDLLAVVWVETAALANAVKAELDEILQDEANPIRGTWFDMTPDVAEQTIRLAAEAVGAKVFDTATRKERLRQEVRRAIERLWRR